MTNGGRRAARALALGLGILAAATHAAADGIEAPRIRGHVRDDAGRPVPGATIALRSFADTDPSVEPSAEAKTGDDGRFVLEAPSAGTWRLAVSAPGRVPREIRLLPLVEPRTLPAVTLAPDEPLTVRVVDADGAPVPGATVAFRADGPGRRFVAAGATWEAARRQAETDAEGVAILPRAPGERGSILVAAEGRALARRDRFAGDALTVRMTPGATRRLLVVGADGDPVPDAEVREAGSDLAIARTDAEGIAAVRVAAPDGIEVAVGTAATGTARVRVLPSGPEAPKTVRLPAIGLVAGRVLDVETRRGLPGAVVWPAGRPEEAVRTDRAGGYVLRLAQGVTVDIEAAAPGYLRPRARPFRAEDDGRPGPAIALAPGAIVEGRVVDDDGEAVAGAALAVAPKPVGGRMGIRVEIGSGGPPEAVADADGTFRIGPIDPDEPWILRATAADHAPGEVDLVGLEPRRTRSGVRVVAPRGGSIVGRVVDGEGAPVPDVAVSASAATPASGGVHVIGPGQQTEPASATSDDDGRFRLSGLAAGTYDLRTKRAGFAAARRTGVEVGAAGEPADAGTIPLRPGVLAQGRVADENGDPIEGVEVRASDAGESGGMMFFLGGAAPPGDAPPDAVTGPDGWFTVEDLDPDRNVTLDFRREGYLGKTEPDVDVPPVEPLAVTLEPSSLLAGVVLDAEDAPVAGADVRLTRTVNATMGNRMIRAISAEDASTDGDGRFRFEGQRPGTVSLEVAAAGRQDVTLDGIEIPRGEDRDDVVVRMEPGAVLVGRVSAPDGSPVAGARVERVGDGEPGIDFGDGATSDGDGYYRLEGLPPGTHSIEVTHPSYVRTVQDVEARAGINGLDFEFEGGQTVRGTVVDAVGNAVPAAWLQLTPAGRRWGGPETRSDGDGRFEFPGVADGEYALRASADGYSAYRGEDAIAIEGAPVEGVVVRLQPGASITGRILGVERDRLGEVRVEAYGVDGGGFLEGTVSSSGEYRVEGAGEGRWRLDATVGRSGRSASADATIEAGETEARVDLEFGTGLALSGRATLAGRPFADASVTAVGEDVDVQAGARTGRDGTFRIEGLEPGRYRLDLRQWSTGIAHRETVEVTSNREVDVEIPVATVRGRATDAVDRDGLAGVHVALVAPDEGDPSPFFSGPAAVSDVDGSFRIENVPDGTWRLVARREGYATTSREIVVREGRGVDDLDVGLDPTEGLRLAVRMPSGRAPDTVTAAVLDGTGRAVESGQYATGESGSVRLSRVPPGSWDVVLSAPGAGTVQVRADAPGAPSEVRLPEACSVRIRVPDLDGANAVAVARLVDARGVPFRRLDWFGGVTSDLRFSSGTLAVDGLAPGEWSVEVRAADGRTWTGRAIASPAAVGEVELR